MSMGYWTYPEEWVVIKDDKSKERDVR